MLWCLHAVDNDVYDTYIEPRGEEGIIKPNKPIDKNQINEMSLGYKFSSSLFHIDKLNQWIEFIEYLEEIWKISVTKIS